MPDNTKTSQLNTCVPSSTVQNKQSTQDDEITIDLVQLFFELRKHIVLLILTTILGGGADPDLHQHLDDLRHE